MLIIAFSPQTNTVWSISTSTSVNSTIRSPKDTGLSAREYATKIVKVIDEPIYVNGSINDTQLIAELADIGCNPLICRPYSHRCLVDLSLLYLSDLLDSGNISTSPAETFTQAAPLPLCQTSATSWKVLAKKLPIEQHPANRVFSFFGVDYNLALPLIAAIRDPRWFISRLPNGDLSAKKLFSFLRLTPLQFANRREYSAVVADLLDSTSINSNDPRGVLARIAKAHKTLETGRLAAARYMIRVWYVYWLSLLIHPEMFVVERAFSRPSEQEAWLNFSEKNNKTPIDAGESPK